MKIDISIVIAIVAAFVSLIVGFFSARIGLKDEINNLKIEHEKLKARDNEQQIILEQFQKQVDQLLPVLIDQLNKKKENE
jgi:Tfp pilus assembly protein PilO